MDAETLQRTPIFEEHKKAGGKLVPFAGWEMPVQYSGLMDEHNTVREQAGLFDVSHMGEARVTGPDAEAYLQHVTCNNVARLKIGRAHYTGIMTPNGAFVDDMLIYRLDVAEFLLVLNAANTPKDLAWLRDKIEGFDAQIVDESDQWAQLALQGPNAQAILEPLVGGDLSEMKYYGFAMLPMNDVPCLISRTGYTGEDGFEIYSPAAAGASIWATLLDKGAAHGIKPIGLGARDTLRLEACMMLYGNDIDDTTTALEANLGWIVKMKKGEFVGRDALAAQKEQGLTRKLVGFEMTGRAIARGGYPACHDGKAVGQVTSGTFSPTLQKRIGLAYLPIDLTTVGTAFEVEIRGRMEPAQVVETPFYRRST